MFRFVVWLIGGYFGATLGEAANKISGPHDWWQPDWVAPVAGMLFCLVVLGGVLDLQQQVKNIENQLERKLGRIDENE